MKIKQIILLSSVLAMAACASNTTSSSTSSSASSTAHQHGHAHSHAHGHAHAADSHAMTFECKNGMTITAQHVGDQVRVSVDTIGDSVTLQRAVSGSGVRYASNNGFYGKPTEFHHNGRDAAFVFTDPQGNQVETACSVKK